MKWKKGLWFTFLIGAISIGAAGCSASKDNSTASSTGSSSGSDLSDITIKVGDVQWKEVSGLLKDADLSDTDYSIEDTVFDSGSVSIESIISGQIDVTRTSEIPPIFASQAANGGNFKVVAVLSDKITTINQEIIVGKDSQIQSIADLKGKKVGYVKGTTAHYFLYKYLEEAGLSWSDIVPVEVTASDGAAALLGGSIDAYAGFGNSIVAAKEKGATTLAKGGEKLSGYFPYVVSSKTLADKQKRAALFDFLGRINQAYKWIKENPEDWAKTNAEPTGQTQTDSLAAIKEGLSLGDSAVIPVSDEVITSGQDVADVFLDAGLLEKKVNVADFYTDKYTSELQAAIAKYQ